MLCTRRIVLLALVMLVVEPANAQRLPPLIMGGGITLGASASRPAEGPENNTFQQLVDVNAASYIWEPWFATVDGSMTFSDSSTRTVGGDFEVAEDQDGEAVSGDLEFHFFPRSHFPLRLYYARSDTRTDVERLPDSTQSTATFFGLSQHYATPGPAGAPVYDLNLEHAELDDDDSLSIRDSVELAAHMSRGEHDFEFLGSAERTDTRDRGRTRETNLEAEFSHYFSDDGFTLDNVASVDDSTSRTGIGRSAGLRSVLLSSFATWTPPRHERLRLTGNAQLRRFESIPSGRSGNSISATTTATFQHTDNLTYGGSLGVSASDDGSRRHFEEVSVRYSGNPRQFAGFDYSWGAGASLSNQSTNVFSEQSAAANFDHGVDRYLPLDIRLSVSQGFSVDRSTEDDTERALSHSVGLGWSRAFGATTYRALFDVSDVRTWREYESVDRFFGFDLGANRPMSRFSHLSMSLSGQASYRELDGADTGDVETRTRNFSLTVDYDHGRVFGVPRLRFESKLVYLDDEVVDLLEEDDDPFDQTQQTNRWTNRIRYPIGKLYLTASANAFRGGGNSADWFYSVYVRRSLGPVGLF